MPKKKKGKEVIRTKGSTAVMGAMDVMNVTTPESSGITIFPPASMTEENKPIAEEDSFLLSYEEGLRELLQFASPKTVIKEKITKEEEQELEEGLRGRLEMVKILYEGERESDLGGGKGLLDLITEKKTSSKVASKAIKESFLEVKKEMEENPDLRLHPLFDPYIEQNYKSICLMDGIRDIGELNDTFFQALVLASNIGSVRNDAPAKGKLNPILVGTPGIGKTSMLKQASLLLGMPVKQLDMQSMDLGAFGGYPFGQDLKDIVSKLEIPPEIKKEMEEKIEILDKKFNSNEQVSYLVPYHVAWIFATGKMVENYNLPGAVLILDELDKTDKETLPAVTNFILKRQWGIASFKDFNLVIIGTANPSKIGGTGQFTNSPALQNKICTIIVDERDEDTRPDTNPQIAYLQFLNKLSRDKLGEKGEKNYMRTILEEKYGPQFLEYHRRMSTPIDFSSKRWKISKELAYSITARYLMYVSRFGIPSKEGGVKSLLDSYLEGMENASSDEFSPFLTGRSLEGVIDVLATSFYYRIKPNVRNAFIGGFLERDMAKDFVKYISSMLSQVEYWEMILSETPELISTSTPFWRKKNT